MTSTGPSGVRTTAITLCLSEASKVFPIIQFPTDPSGFATGNATLVVESLWLVQYRLYIYSETVGETFW